MADPKNQNAAGSTVAKKKVSLKDKLLLLSFVTLDFVGLTSNKDKDGNAIAILTLAEPIPHVRGSQEVEIGGKRYPVTASDVKEIKVHENDFNEDFEFDPDTDTGSYKGSDLMLDVSKTGQVWLRKTSFAAAGNEMRTKGRNERLAKLVGAVVPAGNTTPGKPNVVDTP